ncbi:hypothetical protein OG339_01500 [Streptosporangium sp. NBC_01495]|uniref:hypothetical protein n=1 Tax=Streptosporangium sp. NBC_01495 TaxID=2903899 RepID=UPI002E318831|nr:hypothetical protein [Streptosporangium sp. NBC_01495]
MDEAVCLLYVELQAGQRAITDLTTEDAWLAFIRFGRQRFDTADTPDADGLLYQYGTYSFDGPPTFALNLTRQFEINDSEGDHDHYLQLHCELQYGFASSLRTLGSFASWFFHDTEDDLDQWTEALSNRTAWTIICQHRPAEIKIHWEQV